jgi:hypothetical protein
MKEGNKQKTRSTRWLVWLGILCMIAPVFITFYHLTVMLSQTRQNPSDSLNNVFDWSIGYFVMGNILLFLGLVRRQPISESGKKISAPEAT